MNDILKLSEIYSKKKHAELLPSLESNIPDSLIFLYDKSWETGQSPVPYEILTYLLDCYYCFPERPDLASLFAWQAINHSYNIFLLEDTSKSSLTDNEGLNQLTNRILNQYSKYHPLLFPYYQKLPIKVFHYIAAYLLKGYVMDKNSFPRKYRASSYDTMISKIPVLKDILVNSYGKSLFEISSPTLCNNKIKINADSKQSRAITHSFSKKLQELFISHTTQITLKDTPRTQKTYTFSNQDELTFLIRGILYASRCNNFHGNSASRLNSINADKNTFIMYTDIFLIEYMLLAISLNIHGDLSDISLNKILKNVDLMK